MDFEGIIALIIVAGLLVIIYTRVKRQELKDTWEEIKDLLIKEK